MRLFWTLCLLSACGHVFVDVEEEDTPLDVGVDGGPNTMDGGPNTMDGGPNTMDGAIDAFDAGNRAPDAIDMPDVPPDIPRDVPLDIPPPDAGSPLIGRGLLVRYSMVQRGLADRLISSAMPFPLLPRNPDGTVTTVDTPTGAALQFSTVSVSDGYCASVGAGPVSLLDGSTQGTIEVVALIREADLSSSRLLATGESSAWGFSLGYNDSNNIIFSMNQTFTVFGRWPATPDERHVYTAVVDTTLPNADARLILYIDGVAQTNEGQGLDEGELISVLGTNITCVGNSEGGLRSPRGNIYYAAYYGRALSPMEVATNATLLLADDDL